MSRLLPLALLPLVALLAALVRFERGLPVGSVDEGTAAHLRRIELALLEGEAPLADSFVNPPGGAALPAPPFLDTALAAVAARLSVADGGALGLQDEEAVLAIAADGALARWDCGT